MAKTNQIRIIGGEWRSRRISFPDSAGLRPSADRVRETLFNWLGQDLSGAVCLDLFAIRKSDFFDMIIPNNFFNTCLGTDFYIAGNQFFHGHLRKFRIERIGQNMIKHFYESDVDMIYF